MDKRTWYASKKWLAFALANLTFLLVIAANLIGANVSDMVQTVLAGSLAAGLSVLLTVQGKEDQVRAAQPPALEPPKPPV